MPSVHAEDLPAAQPHRTHAQARAEMRAGIIRAGNAQLHEKGAAGLSVREIARELGVVSSALYRHVKNRDELLTVLLVDAFDDLADAALAAADAAAPEGKAAEFRALVLAAHGWAVANPERWALLYGSPVPGYAAPADATTVAGLRVMRRFAALLLAPGRADGRGAGRLDPDGEAVAATAAPAHEAAPSPAYARDLVAELTELLGTDGAGPAGPDDIDPVRGSATVVAWTGFTGLISAEIFGQIGPILTAHGTEQLECWAREQIERFGLDRL